MEQAKEMTKVEVGFRNVNSKGLWFTVTTKPKDGRVYVQFEDTGTEVLTHVRSARYGQVRDPNARVVLGVGCYGPTGFRAKNIKAARLWRNMLERCYNSSDTVHRSYGADGVYVCDRWLFFPNFVEDLPNLPGYSEWAAGKDYHLDKDLGAKSSKYYGPDVCQFIKGSDNLSLARRREFVFHGSKFTSRRECSHFLGVSESTVDRCLRKSIYPASSVVWVYGKVYRTYRHAAEELGIGLSSLKRRLSKVGTENAQS